jgi:hypothetical protein
MDVLFLTGYLCIIHIVNTIRRVLFIIICATLLASIGVPATAQQTAGFYFSQTRHNVVGEFWKYYQSVPDAVRVFGWPITEQFTSADGSKLMVQYFEKARFELHPEQPMGQRVVLTMVGTELYQAGVNSINLDTPGACRVINGYGVCYDFLSYFDKYGGVAIFGNPISAFEFQADGRLVQYFERARFDWRPEQAAGQNVQLSDFGRIYFNKYEDPAWLNPALPLSGIMDKVPLVLSVRTMAFVSKAVTLTTDTQKVFIIVQDQASGPVSGATGNVTVHLSTGQDLTYPVTTDTKGVSIIQSVPFSNQIPGSLVIVDVEMFYQGMTASASTSFRIWR